MFCIFIIIATPHLSVKELQSSGIITKAANKWYELGIALLDENQLAGLDNIKSSHSETTRRCTEMFKYWLQTHTNATWYQLVDALKSCGVELNDVARMVERSYLGLFIEHKICK